MKLSDLTKNPENPRKITAEKQRMLLKSYKRFGDLSGIVYNRKTQRLVGGHRRQDVFSPDSPIVINKKYSTPSRVGTVALGYVESKGERIPYREVYWDEHTEKAANIAANKGAGEWDPARLKEWMQDLSSFDVNFDLELTMFDPDEIKDIVGIEVKGYTRTNTDTGVDEDDVPEKAPARTKLGDVYILGRHRLVCGDSTSASVIEKLMDGEQVDCVWTDPPYNVALGYDETPAEAKARNRRTDGLTVANDKMSDEKFREFLTSVFKNMVSAAKPGAAVYVSHADSEGYNFRGAMRDAGWLVKQCLIWKKSSLVMGRQDYQWIHEPILYGWKPGAAHTWYGDRKQTTVLEFQKPSRNAEHPTMKPVELVQYCLDNSCSPAGFVLDIFGGSGTTLIACEKTARSCYTVELDPGYCDVIVARWEKYTGLKAQLIRAETKRKPSTQAKVQANGKPKSQAAPEA
ncbi:MAG: DNA modification methylase [Nitrospirota bacterium]|nr:DNA modification methylase [Nitrospirota bacterium]